MSLAMTKTDKIARTRKVREAMSQYQRMQRADLREMFPDWFKIEGDALLTAQVTLEALIREHNREHDRRERQRAKVST